MSLEWDKLYKLGTDVAGFVLFHPARLSRSENDPLGWWMDDCKGEFGLGRLVAFCTGSDGTFTFKFVQRPLTATEKKVLAAKESFRYLVEDGRLFWDNTDCLPSDDQMSYADDDPHGWLELPNGAYRITVHALDWFSVPEEIREAETDISHYIVQFETVSSLNDVPAPKSLPWLVPSKPAATVLKKRAAKKKSGTRKKTTKRNRKKTG